MMLHPHLLSLFTQHLTSRANSPFLYHRKNNKYVSYSYKQIWGEIQRMAVLLRQYGIQKGDRIAILSNNRPEWVVADLATLSLGGIVVPIYPTLSSQEMAYILNDSECKVAFIETGDHLAAIQAEKTSLPFLKKIIVMEQVVLTNSDFVYFYFGSAKPSVAIDVCDVMREDIASIVYTSGTTGSPKGVVLKHDHFLSNLEDIAKAIPISNEDVLLSFLPLSHTFERTTGYYYPLLQGACIYYAENVNTVSRDLLLAKPTAMVSVPRLYEKIYEKITNQLGPLKKRMFDWAVNLGIQYIIQKQEKEFWANIQLKIANLLVFSKIKKRTGGRLKFWVSGGAPLRKDLSVFFRALGLPIIEGYGLTETAPVLACNRFDHIKAGSVGLPLERVQVKCLEDGELLVKGPNVMQEYWHKPEETKAAIDKQGWFHTGDIAKIDEDGFIFIVDRKKELIVLSNGKKVAPQVIEALLVSSPFISQAVVIGDKRHYLTALLYPNKDACLKLTQLVEIKDVLTKEIEDRLSHLARYEQVKKFIVLDHELTAENGFLTPSLKYKRKVIYHYYQAMIDQLYQEEDS